MTNRIKNMLNVKKEGYVTSERAYCDNRSDVQREAIDDKIIYKSIRVILKIYQQD